jgi:hypothetical protein
MSCHELRGWRGVPDQRRGGAVLPGFGSGDRGRMSRDPAASRELASLNQEQS